MTKYRTIDCIISLSALVTGTGIANEAAATTSAYTVTDLGTLGGTYSEGWRINASGQVSGLANIFADGYHHAFLWTPTTPNGASGTPNDLETLGGLDSIGRGINDSGQVAGTSDTTGILFRHAFLYDGAMHDLGTLGGTFSEGWGINDTGQVTGGSQTTGNAAWHAFLYDGTMHDLGSLGGSFGLGWDINADGQVTGESLTTGDAAYHAFLYDGRMHDLGSLGGTSSSGSGINDSGQVAGTSDTTGNAVHAFLYDGAMHDLGTLGGTFSEALGINARGQVSGSSSNENGAFHAFLYTSGSGMVDLNSLIDPLSGWELLFGQGINDAGQITGQGLIGGEQHAFLLTPVPEPSLSALLALGLPLLVWRNSRRSDSDGTRGAHGPMTVSEVPNWRRNTNPR